MNRRRRLARRLLSAVAIAAVAAALTAAGVTNGAFQGFQDRAADAFFPSAKTDPNIVVVGMDEPSLIEYNKPPWPRSVMAQLARQLTAAGAKVVVWDVVFYLPPDTAEDQVQTADLASAITDLEAAGATAILGVDGDLNAARTPGIRTLDPAYPPYESLADAAAGNAHVLVNTADSDGVVRTVPLVVETTDGRFVPSLSLAAVLAYRDASQQPIVGPKGVQAGGKFVPTEGDAQLRLNFARGLDAKLGSKSLVSALDVLDGSADPAQFKDKIVLIGATAESLRDNFDVPIDKSGGIPGVFVHANAINTMLTASYLDVASSTETVLWVAAITLLVALAVLFLPLWVTAVGSTILALLYLLSAAYRFDHGHIVNVIYPLAMIAFAFISALMVRYFTESRHRMRVQALFSQYVPEAVAQQLVEEGRVEQIAEGERLDVSLFFCDLRGFTAMSTLLTPQQVRAMLNEFYDALTHIILEHNGTVLKFVGDEVFAVFGAPLPVEHHPQVALDCALDIQRAAPELSKKLAEMDIPPVHFGIGMNSGDVVAAHVGGGKRRQYDIVGNTVNVGSRMCGQAGKGDIVMTDEMLARFDHTPPARSLGLVQLKGIEHPIELFCIRADTPADPDSDEPGTSNVPATPVDATPLDATMRR